MQRKSGICNRGYDGIYQKAMMMFEDYCNVYSRRYPQYKKLFENHYLFDLMGMAAAMSRNGNAQNLNNLIETLGKMKER